MNDATVQLARDLILATNSQLIQPMAGTTSATDQHVSDPIQIKKVKM